MVFHGTLPLPQKQVIVSILANIPTFNIGKKDGDGISITPERALICLDIKILFLKNSIIMI
jgi:hypothetical protein